MKQIPFLFLVVAAAVLVLLPHPVVVHLDGLYADVALVAHLECVRLGPVPVHLRAGDALPAVAARHRRPPAVRRVGAVVGQGDVALAKGGEGGRGRGGLTIQLLHNKKMDTKPCGKLWVVQRYIVRCGF